MVHFRLPDIGEGLSEAELLEWVVAVGDTVEEGQTVAVISTDKVNVELPSPASGRITERHGEVGEVIPVGTVVLVIDDGRDTQGADDAGLEAVPETDASAAAPLSGESTPLPPSTTGPAAAVRAAPIARRRAAELGVDLASLNGTGPGGQVMLADVETAQESASGRYRLSGANRAAARRLAHSAATLVTTSMSFEAPADRLLAVAESEDVGPLAAITLGLVRTLGRQPQFNARLIDGELELERIDAVHLGLAVTAEDGLRVPVIRNAESLPIQALSAALEKAASRVRDGGLQPRDLQGSTFTLSSTGGLEQASFLATTPVINWPNVATLWVSRIRERPRVMDGRLEAGPMICGTLAFDHRFIHGADGVAFVNDLVRQWQFES